MFVITVLSPTLNTYHHKEKRRVTILRTVYECRLSDVKYNKQSPQPSKFPAVKCSKEFVLNWKRGKRT
ncbi:hypothetical protein E2C01_028072 [Portunus trituberculatus]|uniref:Uncharacterized protein n=1 Tax=Portunus trituberculatus TaxID=210409 RepID=A0A5B7EMN3_PORTR|nr:hypothetical protein [Portunus trituberculatus]